MIPPELAHAPIVRDLYKAAVDRCVAGGLHMEFGVATGTSLRRLRKLIPRDVTLYGFDSFEGLPEAWVTGYPAGTFATAYRVQLPNTVLVEGRFEETVPRFVRERSERVSLVHIDCDLYCSTKTVLEGFRNQIMSGTVIIFDELFGYAGYEQHEYRALMEFEKPFEVIGCWDAYRAVIQIT